MVAKSRVLWVLQSGLTHQHSLCFKKQGFYVHCPSSLEDGSPELRFTSLLLFAPVIMPLRQVALLLCAALIYSWMCWGYFWVVINSREGGGGFCDGMFRQVALFLQLALGCQKMAHFIIFIEYITSESPNILRTLKIKSKFLRTNRRWKTIGNTHPTNILSCLLHIAISWTTSLGPHTHSIQ